MASASLRVQVFPPPGQLQPVPLIETSVRPPGGLSITATLPEGAAPSGALLTVTVEVAPVCPCAKLPVWLLAILSTGEETTAGAEKNMPLTAALAPAVRVTRRIT